VTEPQPDEVTQRLQHLRGMLADLDGYIQRRAEELATPLIEDAAEKAREMVAGAERETQRQRDLVAELRRRISVLEGFREVADIARHRLGEVLGPHVSVAWPSLVAEVETRLAKESK
jgi:hypothetical protein